MPCRAAKISARKMTWKTGNLQRTPWRGGKPRSRSYALLPVLEKYRAIIPDYKITVFERRGPLSGFAQLCL